MNSTNNNSGHPTAASSTSFSYEEDGIVTAQVTVIAEAAEVFNKEERKKDTSHKCHVIVVVSIMFSLLLLVLSAVLLWFLCLRDNSSSLSVLSPEQRATRIQSTIEQYLPESASLWILPDSPQRVALNRMIQLAGEVSYPTEQHILQHYAVSVLLGPPVGPICTSLPNIVFCDPKQKFITKLFLSSVSLAGGGLPKELAVLAPHLQVLDASHSELEGRFPNQLLGQLKALGMFVYRTLVVCTGAIRISYNSYSIFFGRASRYGVQSRHVWNFGERTGSLDQPSRISYLA